MTLRVLVDGAVREQTLRDYLVCVLLAEVPSGFAAEALKAQACAARTFALRQAGAGKHAEADVCASAACCQGLVRPGAVAGARGGGGGRDGDGRACRRL